jgi:hypothetical protein
MPTCWGKQASGQNDFPRTSLRAVADYKKKKLVREALVAKRVNFNGIFWPPFWGKLLASVASGG